MTYNLNRGSSIYVKFPLFALDSVRSVYSLHTVKEAVSDINTISKNNVDHYLFTIRNL